MLIKAEPTGTRRGTEIINAAMKAIQNSHLMASKFNMRHVLLSRSARCCVIITMGLTTTECHNINV